ncbi:predicted protein [Plenodomus lingam JN3]|uniref:Uncharacterized protein n=1 Tax=Leptosphaeria maculans (strain JN3 / isolate v23.1.3 / race Av1-4-5-6-7-8) TaxID=985895 RepID=E5A696_LEPMJ|nr:predicted protein [Plenodomus lingam JN3]CBX99141.1 predicted protein [Plenodomus lingam JN3]
MSNLVPAMKKRTNWDSGYEVTRPADGDLSPKPAGSPSTGTCSRQLGLLYGHRVRILVETPATWRQPALRGIAHRTGSIMAKPQPVRPIDNGRDSKRRSRRNLCKLSERPTVVCLEWDTKKNPLLSPIVTYNTLHADGSDTLALQLIQSASAFRYSDTGDPLQA